MAFDLSSSDLCMEGDLGKLRQVIAWQSSRFDGKMQHGVALLTGMRPGEFIYFSSYALSGLVLPFSSFLLTFLEHYGPRL
jgi:hypothetical protein